METRLWKIAHCLLSHDFPLWIHHFHYSSPFEVAVICAEFSRTGVSKENTTTTRRISARHGARQKFPEVGKFLGRGSTVVVGIGGIAFCRRLRRYSLGAIWSRIYIVRQSWCLVTGRNKPRTGPRSETKNCDQENVLTFGSTRWRSRSGVEERNAKRRESYVCTRGTTRS